MLDIKRYIFPYVVRSNMYILAEGANALVIDPHCSAEADSFLKQSRIEKVTILLTHEHFDHTCGVPWLRENYDTFLVCQSSALDPKIQHRFNNPISVSALLKGSGAKEVAAKIEEEYPSYTYSADKTFDTSLIMDWEGHNISIISAPGHSPASSLITIDNEAVFTGDSLVPNFEPTLRWPYSDKKLYNDVTLPLLMKTDPEMMIYPGHFDPVKMSDLRYIDGKFSTAD